MVRLLFSVRRRLGAAFGASARAREWLLPARHMDGRTLPPLVGFVYVALVAYLGGVRVDHVVIGSLGLVDAYNRRTRLFVRTFLPFIVTGVVFDSMRYYCWAAIEGRVHVAGPYELDRAWFGVGGHTWNEMFAAHHWAVADVATGFAYLTYVGEYLGLALWLFLRGSIARAATFARCFFAVNTMGFVTYFVYPAAPPWYASTHGFGPVEAAVKPSAAAAQRFDQLLDTHVMSGMYGRGVDVFGAIPSLHVAYPLLALVLALRMPELRRVRVPIALFWPLMCFSAVYLQHHYVIDVLLGGTYAVIAVRLVGWWERRRRSTGPGQ